MLLRFYNHWRRTIIFVALSLLLASLLLVPTAQGPFKPSCVFGQFCQSRLPVPDAFELEPTSQFTSYGNDVQIECEWYGYETGLVATRSRNVRFRFEVSWSLTPPNDAQLPELRAIALQLALRNIPPSEYPPELDTARLAQENYEVGEISPAGCLIDALAYLSLLGLGLVWFGVLSKARRADHADYLRRAIAHCRFCGYDFAGLTSGTCPECGQGRVDHVQARARATANETVVPFSGRDTPAG